MRTTCAIAATPRPNRPSAWSGREDLNLRHPAPKAGALPDCATPRWFVPCADSGAPCQSRLGACNTLEPDPPASSPAPPREPIMARRSLGLDDDLYEYLLTQGTRETPVQQRLREETRAKVRGAGMQIGPDQAQAMGLLVRLIGARRALEIGTFTGYSALAVALALPVDGRLVCCDVSDEWTAIARR